MKIELQKIRVREVIAGYKDSAEEGVVAFSGNLDVRPKYQREFVYNGKQRDAVIKTINQDFPLNVMYWMKKDYGNFEMLDGQQRTISIGQFVNGDFSLDNRYFPNLTREEQNQILNYELMIYFCEGTDKERLDWFKTINIAGVKFTDQEVLNAVYTGPWLSDAKLKFSKTNCAASLLASDSGSLLKGSPIRQEYLETALLWINSGKVADYMGKHQHDSDAHVLWIYFQNVIGWVRNSFTIYREEMKGVAWGDLYNELKGEEQDSEGLETKIRQLMDNEEVTKKAGIYPFVLTGQEKHLNLRSFKDNVKREVYERQKGACQLCKDKKKMDFSDMEADHIDPWHSGGKTIPGNCQMLCKQCNRTKSGT